MTKLSDEKLKDLPTLKEKPLQNPKYQKIDIDLNRFRFVECPNDNSKILNGKLML